MNDLKLSSPWMEYYRELDALFVGDPDVEVKLVSEDATMISIYVDGQEKADALTKLLPSMKYFGNVSVYITVIPSNKEDRKVDLFKKAFQGNKAVNEIRTVKGIDGSAVDFVVFDKTVVQFFNDDISDLNGMKSTIYEDIARDVFEDAGVFFCTDIEEKRCKCAE